MERTNAEWSELWDQFLSAGLRETGFMQTSWWIDLSIRYGGRYLDAFFVEDDRVIAGAKVLVTEFEPGACFFHIPEGPVFSENPETAKEQFDGLIAHLDQFRANDPERRYSHLRIEHKWSVLPEFANNLYESTNWIEPRTTAYVDLSGTPEDIRTRMKYNGRRWLKKAIANGVTVLQDRSEAGMRDFMALYRETVARKPMMQMSEEYLVDLMHTLFENGRGSLYFAEHLGKRVATAIVVFFGDRVTYLYAASADESLGLMAPYLLNYQIMCDAQSRGYRCYDFYGAVPASVTEHQWATISVFKHNMGGVDVDFGPSLDHIYDDDAYRGYLRYIDSLYGGVTPYGE